MRIGSQLSKKQRQQLRKSANKNEIVNWHELMGVNRDTYKRVKGRLRKC